MIRSRFTKKRALVAAQRRQRPRDRGHRVRVLDHLGLGLGLRHGRLGRRRDGRRRPGQRDLPRRQRARDDHDHELELDAEAVRHATCT